MRKSEGSVTLEPRESRGLGNTTQVSALIGCLASVIVFPRIWESPGSGNQDRPKTKREVGHHTRYKSVQKTPNLQPRRQAGCIRVRRPPPSLCPFKWISDVHSRGDSTLCSQAKRAAICILATQKQAPSQKPRCRILGLPLWWLDMERYRTFCN